LFALAYVTFQQQLKIQLIAIMNETMIPLSSSRKKALPTGVPSEASKLLLVLEILEDCVARVHGASV